MKWLKDAGRFPADYYLEFINDSSYSYIHQQTGKRRFKQLPDILRQMNPYSKSYKEFVAKLEKFAAEKNCSPKGLGDAREWEDFKW